LYVANHVSYTDITVLGSVIPGSFIAKAEVADWPFFGWLAKLQRSVFVDRQVRSTVTQRDAVGERLASGDALILFPEGTSGDGNRVLPFKTALFGAWRGSGRSRWWSNSTRRPFSPIAGRARRSLPIAMRVFPAVWQPLCSVDRSRCRNRRGPPRATHFRHH
jgi:1-acyl-sn-glycerol-3-phosphate acyltransferase